MTTITELLDEDARFTVGGYRGVAFYAIGATTEHRYDEPTHELVCSDEDHDHDEDCYLVLWDEEGYDVEAGTVDAVMVGDDRVFQVDPEDCTLIADEDYCSGCGQVGCHAYA
jgi:hypothetical protein